MNSRPVTDERHSSGELRRFFLPHTPVIWDMHSQVACLNSKFCWPWSSLFELPFLVDEQYPDLCHLPQSGVVPEPVSRPLAMPS